MYTTQPGYFIAEWETCSVREKAEIIAEFLRENEGTIGWEGWQGFLLDKFCIIANTRGQEGLPGNS